jgi:hypothetical protein
MLIVCPSRRDLRKRLHYNTGWLRRVHAHNEESSHKQQSIKSTPFVGKEAVILKKALSFNKATQKEKKRKRGGENKLLR